MDLYVPDLSSRMKSYESDSEIPNDQFLLIRIDGNKFSTFTKNLGAEKPYDDRVARAMKAASDRVCDYFNGLFYYTQSDETTIVVPPTKFTRSFNSRIQKTASIAASLFTFWFNNEIEQHNPDGCIALFDARVFGIATQNDVVNNILWRIQDAQRNWTQSCARMHYGQAEITGVPNSQLESMLEKDDVDIWALGEGLGSFKPRKLRNHYVRPVFNMTFEQVGALVDSAIKAAEAPRTPVVTSVSSEPSVDPSRTTLVAHMAEMQKGSYNHNLDIDLEDSVRKQLQVEAIRARVPFEVLLSYVVTKKARQIIEQKIQESRTSDMERQASGSDPERLS